MTERGKPVRNSDERVKVRTTIRPDVELEVTEAERRDLIAQGLLTEKKGG